MDGSLALSQRDITVIMHGACRESLLSAEYGVSSANMPATGPRGRGLSLDMDVEPSVFGIIDPRRCPALSSWKEGGNLRLRGRDEAGRMGT